MSVCLETSSVLANQVSTSTATPISDDASIAPTSTDQPEAPQPAPSVRTIAKLPSSANAALSKASLITVLNTPLGNVKTLCVTPAVSSNATGQFTVVNSATPLNVANSTVKPQTITLINTPVTVVKTISPSVEKSAADVVPNSAAAAVPALIENRGHNVFVKNTACSEGASQDVPQGHKLLTANNFPTNNVLTTAINVNDVSAQKTVNGQRNKVKILNNVLMPGTSAGGGNILLNKPSNVPQRYVSRQKILGANNGATTKYLNKPPNNVVNKQPVNMINKQQPSQRVLYPTHKSQIKTLPPVNNYLHGKAPGIKTLPPHPKGIPGQVQRTGSGLRTIPPQRPQKIPNKPNYIGKHAVQAQKLKQPHKLKSMKPNQMYNSYHSAPVQEKQMTFNQALTAEIIETLSNKSNMTSSFSSKSFESLPPRYENAYYPPEMKPTFSSEQAKPMEERNKSGLDLIYQAVLLDHNYNATLPPESPTRSIPTPNTPSQLNGVSGSSMYSPGSGKRRSLSTSNPISSSTSLSTLSAVASNSNSIGLQDDDAASDISDGSDRKQDTEGEETDTAPEAEAVNNEDQFGDYVTRCICGFIHDDGYMIECDRCKVWQHVQCVVKNKQVPEEYLCEVCDPHKHIDRQKARHMQQQWLRERQFADPKLRKDTKLKEVFKHKETLSDTDTSDGEHQGHNNNIVSKRPNIVNRRKSDNHPKGSARQRRDSAKEVAQRRQIKKRERKVVKRKTKAQLKNHSDDESHDPPSSTHLPQLRQWIENYEEAVTNHYSPELRARISNIRVNGAHTDFSVQFEPSVHKCRVHTQPLTELKYLVSTVHLPPNSPVIELRGKYMLSAQHRNSGSAFNTRQHAQRPGPFLFFYRLHKDNTEVCVDTRTYGNSARFIRRSCKPNAELRHSIVKGVLHLYIVTITNVEKNVELTIKHESHDLAAIGTTHIACACGNVDECTVNRTTVKKNGDTTEMHKKRRGRRTTSLSLSSEPELPPSKPPKKEPVVQPPASPSTPVKQEVELEEDEIKTEPEEIVKPEPEEIKPEVKEEVVEPVVEEAPPPEVKDVKVKEEDVKPAPQTPPTPPIATRRSSSHHKVEKEEGKESPQEAKEESSPPVEKNKNKKLSREERKLEAILRAIAQMEKADQRKQEHQAKQAHRRESEPGPGKEEDKLEPKLKRKRYDMVLYTCSL
ncbi:hypothetical protein Zmor_025147 [Zophobas morio]|uniref:SET domain-containing protein n=1 Tax=Zophobas morio TaxID=2755281 RepID=A0AA38M4M7_9CUCU|nr:hypothetical protein Zmor_025147 [Zophobas morio]